MKWIFSTILAFIIASLAIVWILITTPVILTLLSIALMLVIIDKLLEKYK